MSRAGSAGAGGLRALALVVLASLAPMLLNGCLVGAEERWSAEIIGHVRDASGAPVANVEVYGFASPSRSEECEREDIQPEPPPRAVTDAMGDLRFTVSTGWSGHHCLVLHVVPPPTTPWAAQDTLIPAGRFRPKRERPRRRVEFTVTLSERASAAQE